MMLKKLYQIGQEMRSTDEWPVELYTPRAIRWEIWLTEDGNLRPDGVKSFEQRGEDAIRVNCPDIGRSSDINPYLIVDDPSYVLGIGNKGEEKHEAYMKLLEDCGQEIHSVRVIHQFISQHLNDLRTELEARGLNSADEQDNRSAKGWINFKVGSSYPIDEQSVKDWWRCYVKRTLETQSEEVCVVSGQQTRTVRKFPVDVPITYFQDGRRRQQMCKLVTVDSAAFRSYGYEQAEHAPMSFDAAVIAGTAMNVMLNSSECHRLLGDLNFVFWTKHKPMRTGFAALVTVNEDSTRQSKILAFWGSVFTGREYYPPTDKFYVLGVTNNKSRVVVRTSFETSLNTAVANVKDWFESVELKGPGPDFLTFSSIHRSLQINNKRQNRSAALALVKRAFFGLPLDRTVYGSVFPRILSTIHDSKREPRWRCPSKEQVAFIKLYLSQSNPEVKNLVALKEDFPNIAYHYGRLLAAYEAIQLDASPDVQSTITERFISSMMVNPKRTIAKLDVLSKAHLRKVARDKGKGYTVNHSKRLQSINNAISAHGAAQLGSLSLDQRGLFVLGYWHEKFRTYNSTETVEENQNETGSDNYEQD